MVRLPVQIVPTKAFLHQMVLVLSTAVYAILGTLGMGRVQRATLPCGVLVGLHIPVLVIPRLILVLAA